MSYPTIKPRTMLAIWPGLTSVQIPRQRPLFGQTLLRLFRKIKHRVEMASMPIPRQESYMAANLVGIAFEDKIMEYIFARSHRGTVKCCLTLVRLIILEIGTVSYQNCEGVEDIKDCKSICSVHVRGVVILFGKH